jgi:predicted TIM-barrel fold metal-dependent hydrolase
MTPQPSPARFPIFDAHFHIIDHRYPLVSNQGYLPPEFSSAAYQEIARRLGIVGGALVSGSYHGFDRTFLLDALERLGENFVGVLQLPATVSDEDILALDRVGVRGVRFNVKRGGSAAITDLERMARRLDALAGWHVELYIDSRHLAGLFDTLVRLPKVSIDHLGLTREGFPVLLRLAERGVRIKATGFGRVDFPVADALRDIAQANPHSLMFGTDLPGTRAPRAFDERDLGLVADTLGEALARRVFSDNAAVFYRIQADGKRSTRG